MARAIGDRRSEGVALNNLGLAYRFVKNFQQAAASYQQALPIAQTMGDRREKARRRRQESFNLGLSYQSMGNLADAMAVSKSGCRLRVRRRMERGEIFALRHLCGCCVG